MIKKLTEDDLIRRECVLIEKQLREIPDAEERVEYLLSKFKQDKFRLVVCGHLNKNFADKYFYFSLDNGQIPKINITVKETSKHFTRDSRNIFNNSFFEDVKKSIYTTFGINAEFDVNRKYIYWN